MQRRRFDCDLFGYPRLLAIEEARRALSALRDARPSVNPTPEPSGHAVRAANPAASAWGGGVKLTCHCFDARAFTGLSFRVKGTTPKTTFEVSLTSGAGATVGKVVALPPGWETIRVPFAEMSGVGETPRATTTLGEDITEITFSSQLNYVQAPGATSWVPQAGAFDLAVDDIAFY